MGKAMAPAQTHLLISADCLFMVLVHGLDADLA
jgi:hypothetical protein